jgi:site-specific DNA-methyltransferase (adenine-specific)
MSEFTNTLYTNDNLFILNGLNSNLVDLIYLDPPFNTNRIFSAPIGSPAAGASFKDMWTWQDVNETYLEMLSDKHPSLVKFIVSVGGIHGKPMMAYLTYMAQRIIEMHRVLKDTGSLYLHCDPTASHYLKLLLDDIFGKKNFRNEIVWHYGGPSKRKTSFPQKYDSILFYSKNIKTNFNPQYKHIPDYLFERARKDADGRLWVDQRLGELTAEKIEQMKSEKRIFTTLTGNLRRKQYLDEMKGVQINDVWNIPIINSQSKERTGYETQKPLALLNRIILASTNEGDIVMDPFCGCATTCVAAQHLGRKWIGIDIGEQVVRLLVDRLTDASGAMFKDFIATKLVPKRTDVTYESSDSISVKERLYKAQKGLCNGCGKEYFIKDFEIDHIIPQAKGGGDYYENYQLLCGNCNKIKGTRPMEYLRKKIQIREEMLKDKIIFGE